MRKRKHVKSALPSSQIVHFETPSLSVKFKEADNGHIYTKALVLVEGDHVDSKQRHHQFPVDRVRQVVENTNLLISKGARIPLLTDHLKTQDTTIGDVDSQLEARIITDADISDPRYKHLVGKFGAFVNSVVIKAEKAVKQYKDKLLSTISPGIDIVSDTIREISCTSTPAIVGLSLFKRIDNMADFALSFDELEQSGSDIDQLKEQYDNLSEQLWVILTSVLTADQDDLQDTNQSVLLEQALDDFESRLLDVLGVEEDDGEEDSYDSEDQAAQSTGKQMPQMTKPSSQSQQSMPRTISQRTGTAQYSADYKPVLAAFTLDEMEKISEFGLGSNIMKAATNVASRLGKEKASIAHQGGLGKAVASGLGRTVGAAKTGFKTAKAAAGTGKLKSNLAGALGGAKGALGTRGGKLAAGALGTGAITATGIGVMNKLRKPKKPKF